MTDPNATPQPANDDAPAAAGAAPAEAPADPVETLTRETAELKDKLLRALAEMENVRRRSERDVADARTYGITGFARDVLGVADNMRRALEAIGAELRARADDGVKSLIEGVELTERELLKVMEKHGVKRFDPQGEKFDPNLHQAMFEVPDPSVPNGTVREVVQSGFVIGDRVLRPALVGVAKGGAKPAAAGEAAGASVDKQA
jgi:molecular chaperone GrpE